jgi:hypothetical protein
VPHHGELVQEELLKSRRGNPEVEGQARNCVTARRDERSQQGSVGDIRGRAGGGAYKPAESGAVGNDVTRVSGTHNDRPLSPVAQGGLGSILASVSGPPGP